MVDGCSDILYVTDGWFRFHDHLDAPETHTTKSG